MEINVSSSKREDIIDITSQVESVVSSFSDEAKACLVYIPHTTCGVLIQENYDPDVNEDILEHLSKIPREGWRHMEGNSDSHIKSMIVGPSKVIPIENGKLMIGRWQGISLCEFDGPRERKVILKEL